VHQTGEGEGKSIGNSDGTVNSNNGKYDSSGVTESWKNKVTNDRMTEKYMKM
jgi:hypothetical protein